MGVTTLNFGSRFTNVGPNPNLCTSGSCTTGSNFGYLPQAAAVDGKTHFAYYGLGLVAMSNGTLNEGVYFNSTVTIASPFAIIYDPWLQQTVITSDNGVSGPYVYFVSGTTIKHQDLTYVQSPLLHSNCTIPEGAIYSPANHEVYVSCGGSTTTYTGYLTISAAGKILNWTQLNLYPSNDPFVYDPFSQDVFIFGEPLASPYYMYEISHSINKTTGVSVPCNPDKWWEGGEGAAYSGPQAYGDVLVTCPMTNAIDIVHTIAGGGVSSTGGMSLPGARCPSCHDPFSGNFYITQSSSLGPTTAVAISPLDNLIDGTLVVLSGELGFIGNPSGVGLYRHPFGDLLGELASYRVWYGIRDRNAIIFEPNLSFRALWHRFLTGQQSRRHKRTFPHYRRVRWERPYWDKCIHRFQRTIYRGLSVGPDSRLCGRRYWDRLSAPLPHQRPGYRGAHLVDDSCWQQRQSTLVFPTRTGAACSRYRK